MEIIRVLFEDTSESSVIKCWLWSLMLIISQFFNYVMNTKSLSVLSIIIPLRIWLVTSILVKIIVIIFFLFIRIEYEILFVGSEFFFFLPLTPQALF